MAVRLRRLEALAFGGDLITFVGHCLLSGGFQK